MFETSQLVISFITLFMIMDPIAAVPLFSAVTLRMDDLERKKAAMTAVGFAYVVLIPFIFLGTAILSAFNITLASFKIAGGILLFIIAARMLFSEETKKVSVKKIESQLLLIAVPLITGPGAISSAILLSSSYGWIIVSIAATLAFAASYLIISNAGIIERTINKRAMHLLTKVILLLVASIAVQFVVNGVLDVFSLPSQL